MVFTNLTTDIISVLAPGLARLTAAWWRTQGAGPACPRCPPSPRPRGCPWSPAPCRPPCPWTTSTWARRRTQPATSQTGRASFPFYYSHESLISSSTIFFRTIEALTITEYEGSPRRYGPRKPGSKSSSHHHAQRQHRQHRQHQHSARRGSQSLWHTLEAELVNCLS